MITINIKVDKENYGERDFKTIEEARQGINGFLDNLSNDYIEEDLKDD
jgi:hypothetical protein